MCETPRFQPLKDNASPTGLVLFWENLVQTSTPLHQMGFLECQIEHLRKMYTSLE